MKNPSINESEALEVLNILSKRLVLHKFNYEKAKIKKMFLIMAPITILMSPFICLTIFLLFLKMKAGFKHSLKATFLIFISIIMAIRGRILIIKTPKLTPKKYNVFPGMVKSMDGDKHFISAAALIKLYKVDPKECVICKDTLGIENSLISLRPRSSGNYTVPKVKILGKSVEV